MRNRSRAGLCLLMVFALVAVVSAKSYQGKKILFVDSYHEGYAWSDGVTKGIKSVLDASGAELKIVRMDTKRNGAEDFKVEAGKKAKTAIDEFKPDLVIACDDNAAKYLVVPFYKGGALPFVFCGVNWDASVYGFPSKNVTGMLEVSDFKGLVNLLRNISKGQKIGFIADDTETTRKEALYAKIIFNIDLVPHFSKDFEDWKKGYADLQGQVDALIFYSYAGIKDWNDKAAAEFVEANTKIPTGTLKEETMPYVMIGFLKVPEEQGQWSANAALKILDGASPADIPVAKNTMGDVVVNLKLANKAGVEIPKDLIQTAGSVVK